MRYAITNLNSAADVPVFDTPKNRQGRWLCDLRRWAAEGIDFVQLREKELGAGEVYRLAASGMGLLREPPAAGRPRLLLNGRPDLAAAAGSDGVHLTGRPGELRPAQVRQVFAAAGLPGCVISVSCHTLAEIEAARDGGADLILFGPVFEKRVGGQVVVPGSGLHGLALAVQTAGRVPMLALGGVTEATMAACRDAGAAGVAGIRLFAGVAPTWRVRADAQP